MSGLDAPGYRPVAQVGEHRPPKPAELRVRLLPGLSIGDGMFEFILGVSVGAVVGVLFMFIFILVVILD